MTGAGYQTICTYEVGEGKHCIRYDRCGNPDKNGSRSVSYEICRKPQYTEIDNITSTDCLKYYAVDNGCYCKIYPCSAKECGGTRISDELKALAFAVCQQPVIKNV